MHDLEKKPKKPHLHTQLDRLSIYLNVALKSIAVDICINTQNKFTLTHTFTLKDTYTGR